MKAHRRKGIPTLMLQTGGKVEVKPYSESPIRGAKPRDLPKSPAGRRFYIPGIPGDYEGAESLMRRKYFRNLKPLTGVQLEDISADDYETFKQAISPLAGLRSLAKNTPGRGREAYIPFSALKNRDPRPEYRDKIASAVGSLSRLPEGFVPQVVDPLKQSLESELSRLSPRLGSPAPGYGSVQEALLESAKSSSEAAAQEAARQEQESAAPQPPETPAEAAQAEQAAETAKASQAAASVSSPEEEALRQATGAPSSAEEAAAATKSGDLSQEASLVKGKDGTTIAGIMGSADAQFNETERLNELKTTFGLNLSDMEKAAPGIAFSLSLMGAQRAPGESVFNALARSAGSAGEGALKAKLALDAKERAIDSSLVSTVLGEKKIADAYAKNKTWAVVWDGSFDKNGSPGASFYRMNARQLDEATEAGLPIVPMDFLKSSMTTEGAKAAYRSKAGIDSRKNLMDQLMERAKPVSTEIEVGGDKYKAQVWTDRSGVRHVLPIDIAGVANGLNAQLADTSKFLRSTAEMRTYVPQISGGPNVVAAFGGRLRAIAGVSQDEIDRTPEQLAGAIFAKARKEFDTVKLGGLLSGKNAAANISSEMSSDEIGKYFGKEAQDLAESGDAEALQKLIQGRLPQITNLTMPERPGEGAKPEELTSYQARVKYKTIQNALAAQLAPILLGESGRTISDADRVRVIALLGGFADYSKAGVVTTEFEMNASIDELESILRKYQKTSKDASETFLTNVAEASQANSWDSVQGKIYNPTIAQNKALGRLGENFVRIFGSPDGSGNPDQPDSTQTRKLSELVE